VAAIALTSGTRTLVRGEQAGQGRVRRKSCSSARRAVGPMLHTGMPSRPAICAYGVGGSVSSSWSRVRWCSLLLRATVAQRCMPFLREQVVVESRVVGAHSSAEPVGVDTDRPASCRQDPHASWRVVVTIQAGSARGSRISARCSTRRSQSVWLTSWASSAPRRYLLITDDTSGR
jgi:hypothetical protein